MTAKRNIIQLKLPMPHSGQKRLLEEADRFNTVNCGRRWGKTTIGQNLLVDPALKGFPTAWFSPTYKDLFEVWKYIKRTLQPVIRSKNEQLKQIELLTGGAIDFWSLDDPESGRGRKYKRIVVDEVAKMKGFDRTWRQTLRPTLTDLIGDAFMFSTPKGISNHWYDMCQIEAKGWKNFRMPSSSNPYLPKEELEAARDELPPLDYAQEYDAEFVDIGDSMFFAGFDRHKHAIFEYEIDPIEPLWLSFDFNMEPTTAIVSQKIDGKGLFIYHCHQIKGGTEVLCDEYLGFYMNHPAGLLVTGDHSGHSGSTAAGLLQGGQYNTDYEVIKDKLWLREEDLVDTRTANRKFEYSRRLCNRVFHHVPVFVNESCASLIYDLRTGRVDNRGKLLKDRDKHKQDAGDAFRYQIHAWFPEGYRSVKDFAWQFITTDNVQ